jgi:hypothetical protein
MNQRCSDVSGRGMRQTLGTFDAMPAVCEKRKETSMDQETKQWIVDRVIWVLGLTVSVLVAATAFAGEHNVSSAKEDTTIARYWTSVCIAANALLEAS